MGTKRTARFAAQAYVGSMSSRSFQFFGPPRPIREARLEARDALPVADRVERHRFLPLCTSPRSMRRVGNPRRSLTWFRVGTVIRSVSPYGRDAPFQARAGIDCVVDHRSVHGLLPAGGAAERTTGVDRSADRDRRVTDGAPG